MPEILDGLDHPPVIGETYRVGVALSAITGKHRGLHPLLDGAHWWPYRGRMHTDPDFKAYEQHLHIDARVLTSQELEAVVLIYERRELDAGRTPCLEAAPYMIPINRSTIRGYMAVERACLRHDVAPESGRWTDAAVSDLLAGNPNRERWHLGKRRICPHHKYDLRSAIPDADGCVTCPLHQLKYGPDGKMVISDEARKSAEIKRSLRLLFGD